MYMLNYWFSNYGLGTTSDPQRQHRDLKTLQEFFEILYYPINDKTVNLYYELLVHIYENSV